MEQLGNCSIATEQVSGGDTLLQSSHGAGETEGHSESHRSPLDLGGVADGLPGAKRRCFNVYLSIRSGAAVISHLSGKILFVLRRFWICKRTLTIIAEFALAPGFVFISLALFRA